MSENPRSSDQGQGVGATVTILAILLVTLVPAVGMRLKTTPLNAGEWALVVGTVLLGTFWIEARKWLLAGRIQGEHVSDGNS
jgi:hypothetical protein